MKKETDPKKKKRDVKPKSDVTEDENGTQKMKKKKKKRDVKPKSDVTEDPKKKKRDGENR